MNINMSESAKKSPRSPSSHDENKTKLYKINVLNIKTITGKTWSALDRCPPSRDRWQSGIISRAILHPQTAVYAQLARMFYGSPILLNAFRDCEFLRPVQIFIFGEIVLEQGIQLCNNNTEGKSVVLLLPVANKKKY